MADDEESEPIPAPAPATVRKCSRLSWCYGMRTALAGVQENSEGKGLSPSRGWFKNDTRGPLRRWVTYYPKARGTGIKLNYCPWCGADIRWDSASAELSPAKAE